MPAVLLVLLCGKMPNYHHYYDTSYNFCIITRTIVKIIVSDDTFLPHANIKIFVSRNGCNFARGYQRFFFSKFGDFIEFYEYMWICINSTNILTQIFYTIFSEYYSPKYWIHMTFCLYGKLTNKIIIILWYFCNVFASFGWF